MTTLTLSDRFYELAKPATLEVTGDEITITFRMRYCGLAYRYMLSRYTLLNCSSATNICDISCNFSS